MNCESCKERRKQAEPVPFQVHEADMARQERTIKKLWITILVLIGVILAGVIWFVWRESQFEDIIITAEQQADGDSNNYAIGGDYYGVPAKGDD